MNSAWRVAAAGWTLALFGCGSGTSGPSVPTAPGPAAPAPDPCESMQLEVEAFLPEAARSFPAGEMRLVAVDGATALDFVSPYATVIPDGGANLDVPGLSPTVGVFVSAFAFERRGEGFLQTMTVEWTGELRVRAEAPGCPPLEVRCDAVGCSDSFPFS